jgi:hypothetical protein
LNNVVGKLPPASKAVPPWLPFAQRGANAAGKQKWTN